MVQEKDIPIEITGTRPGERFTEHLSVSPLEATDHEKVLVAMPQYPGAPSMGVALNELLEALEGGNEREIRRILLDTASVDWTGIEIDLRDEPAVGFISPTRGSVAQSGN